MDLMTSFVLVVIFGGVSLFFTGFLKKAGEDCYSLVKKKLKPASLESQIPQMIIQVKTEGASAAIENVVSDKRVSSLNFDDIAKSITSAPPMQRDFVAERYIGIRVEWDTYFKSGSLVGDNLMELRFTTDKKYPINTVYCKVPADKNREFGILPEYTKVRVSGELAKVNRFDVELTDVLLQVFHNSL